VLRFLADGNDELIQGQGKFITDDRHGFSAGRDIKISKCHVLADEIQELAVDPLGSERGYHESELYALGFGGKDFFFQGRHVLPGPPVQDGHLFGPES